MNNLITLRDLDKIIVLDLAENVIKNEQYELLSTKLQDVVKKGKDVAVNLKAIPMINSGVINMFITAAKALHPKAAKLYILNPTEYVKALLFVNHLDRLVYIVENEKDLLG